jgi:hypothetical protein
MCFWFIPKTASMASSSTGELVAAGSLQPNKTPESNHVPTNYAPPINAKQNKLGIEFLGSH